MKSEIDLFTLATGGLEDIADNMMPATGPRPFLLSEPDSGLLWLSLHGDDLGYSKDKNSYRLLPFIARQGNLFEANYLKFEAPCAVHLLDNDWEVRKASSIDKTITHLKKGTKFLHKVALWWAPAQIYGVADAVVSTDWFYEKYPQHKPSKPEKQHYIVADFKLSMNLDQPEKKAHLAAASTQLRIYSYILGHLTGHMPDKCYIISRDRIHDPIAIDVNLKLGEPLPEELRDLRDDYLDIKQNGKEYRPWRDKKVALNPANKEDEPWSEAKRQILEEKVKIRPLVMLPGVGSKTAANMRKQGYTSVDDLLNRDVERLDLSVVDGISSALADRIKAVLKANKTGKATPVPEELMPKRAQTELFIDMEYFTCMNISFEDWPDLTGTPMVFMIGVGWYDKSEWRFKRFTAEAETHEAEGKMLRQFLRFLREKGVTDPTQDVKMYHWSGAEVSTTKRAVERHGLTQLLDLPWFDLLDVLKDGNVCLPGMWNFGLKEVTQSLSDYASRYSVEWGDELASGSAAMVAGWGAYATDTPLKSDEMKLVGNYLEKDVCALANILRWLRAVCREQKRESSVKKSSCRWYTRQTSADTTRNDNDFSWYQIGKQIVISSKH